MNKAPRTALPAGGSDWERRLVALLEQYHNRVSSAIDQAADGYLTQTTSVSTSYTASMNDSVVLVDSTGGDKTVTLPGVGNSKTKRMAVKKLVAGNKVIVDPSDAALIDNVTSYTMTTALASVDFVSDGTNWWTV